MLICGPHTKGKSPRREASYSILRVKGEVQLILIDSRGRIVEVDCTEEEARRLACALYGPETEGGR
jgi:hypothetical protein